MDPSEIAVATFNKYAYQYQNKYNDVSLYAEELNDFCARLPTENPEILELACGPGNLSRYVINKNSSIKLLGTDLAPKMLQLAKDNNPTASFLKMDCRTMKQLNRKFNGVLCGFALPYLSKEESIKLIADAAEMLYPTGVIFISTMEDDYQKSGLSISSTGDQLFIYYHEKNYLVKAMEENGFNDIKFTRKQYEIAGVATTDLILIGTLKEQ